ncbi:MAG: hypothetical protein HYY96_14040 [Candidatus Tectomicrobia bacterium]|nr:hypothetical protein [Candidatus Tectomicrobia bacterium]
MTNENLTEAVRELNVLLNQYGIAEVLSKIEAGVKLPDLSSALRNLRDHLPPELLGFVDLAGSSANAEEEWPRRLLSILLLLKNCTEDQVALVAEIVGNMLKLKEQ